jgi:hypothetical protein
LHITQFRALSDQLFRSPAHHEHVRRRVVRQLRARPERYSAHVPEAFRQYCTRMAGDGSWGDHVTLQAAADAYGARVCVLTSFMESCFIEIQPEEQGTDRVLWLSFWAEVGAAGAGRRQQAGAAVCVAEVAGGKLPISRPGSAAADGMRPAWAAAEEKAANSTSCIACLQVHYNSIYPKEAQAGSSSGAVRLLRAADDLLLGGLGGRAAAAVW